MKKKEKDRFRYYDRLLRRMADDSAKDEAVPVSCRLCEYYQPDFRYRWCLFVKCPYKKEKDVFRSRPLRKDPFS